MDAINELVQYTEALAIKIYAVSEDEINILLDKRDNVLKLLQSGYSLSTEEKEKLNKLDNYDRLFVDRMNAIMNEATNELKKINQAKVQQKGYADNYYANSYFIDNKQ